MIANPSYQGVLGFTLLFCVTEKRKANLLGTFGDPFGTATIIESIPGKVRVLLVRTSRFGCAHDSQPPGSGAR